MTTQKNPEPIQSQELNYEQYYDESLQEEAEKHHDEFKKGLEKAIDKNTTKAIEDWKASLRKSSKNFKKMSDIDLNSIAAGTVDSMVSRYALNISELSIDPLGYAKQKENMEAACALVEMGIDSFYHTKPKEVGSTLNETNRKVLYLQRYSAADMWPELPFYAAEKGHKGALERMMMNDNITRSGLLDKTNADGKTVLDLAKENGHEELSKYLESKGAKTSALVKGLDDPAIKAAAQITQYTPPTSRSASPTGVGITPSRRKITEL